MTGFRIAGAPAPYLHHEATAARAPHGFFGVAGGVSTGLYASLNCGYGSQDDPVLVAQNRGRVAAAMALPADRLAAVYQVHGTDVVIAEEGAPEDRSQLARADGLVTTQRGLGLTILTADCLPLLLVDDGGDVIGACHAGWRGAAAGIVGTTVDAMRAAGAGLITALIGPTIRQESYQVGAEMRDEVLAQVAPEIRDDASTCFIDDAPGKLRFDLALLVRLQLYQAGIDQLHDCGVDTYVGNRTDDPDSLDYFSHRRATHAADTDCGRQIAVIARPPADA
jgi:YfiH family protein